MRVVLLSVTAALVGLSLDRTQASLTPHWPERRTGGDGGPGSEPPPAPGLHGLPLHPPGGTAWGYRPDTGLREWSGNAGFRSLEGIQDRELRAGPLMVSTGADLFDLNQYLISEPGHHPYPQDPARSWSSRTSRGARPWRSCVRLAPRDTTIAS